MAVPDIHSETPGERIREVTTYLSYRHDKLVERSRNHKNQNIVLLAEKLS